MIFSRALGKMVYGTCHPSNPGKPEMGMSNAFAWCPYPKCKHAQDRGGTFLRHFEKEHQNKSVPSIGIRNAIALRIRQNRGVMVGEFLGENSGWVCSKCGHFGLTPRALADHIVAKHRGDAINWECHVGPVVRPGEGEGDDPTLKQETEALVQQAKARHGEWTREKAEEIGRRWHQSIMEQWRQGVQEKQISRAKAKFIRKEVSRSSSRTTFCQYGKLGKLCHSRPSKGSMRCPFRCRER
jgi:hypothetical protein